MTTEFEEIDGKLYQVHEHDFEVVKDSIYKLQIGAYKYKKKCKICGLTQDGENSIFGRILEIHDSK